MCKHTYLIKVCNCTNIMILSISFECINDSLARYSFFITGEGSSEVTAVFNHSFNSHKHLTTDDGISFSSHSSVKTSASQNEDDGVTIQLTVFITLVLAVFFTVGLVLIIGLSVGM